MVDILATGELERVTQPAFRFGRIGYVSKALVYLLSGVLTLKAALGEKAPLTDQAGALRSIAGSWLGRGALLVLGCGLLVYTVMMILKSLVDPERRGTGPLALLIRLGELITATGHGLLGYGALQLVARTGGPQSGDARAKAVTAAALRVPGGVWLMIAIALGLIILGMVLLLRGLLASQLCRDLDVAAVNAEMVRGIEFIIRVGLLVQGTLFSLVGMGLAIAAVFGRPGAARGPGGVLRMLARFPHGSVLVGVIGVGLLAIGVAALADARWRRFAPPPA